MKSAVITPCSHFFHAGCLKKWLYVQETCPLCHCHLKNSSQFPGAATEPAPQPRAGAEQNAVRQEGAQPAPQPAPQPRAGAEENAEHQEGAQPAPQPAPQPRAGAEEGTQPAPQPAPQPRAGAEQNAVRQEGTAPLDQEHPGGTGMERGSRDNNECIASRLDSQEGTCEPTE